VKPLNDFACKRYTSQRGQTGMLIEIMRRLGIASGSCLEFGASDGVYCSNIRHFYLHGWECGYIEADVDKYQELCINTTAAKHMCMRVTCEPNATLDWSIKQLRMNELTLLCIDVDGIDYWIWKSLEQHPAVVCIEYNSNFDPEEQRVIEYDPNFNWRNGDTYYGASAGAMCSLAYDKGYALVAYALGNDLIFLRRDLLASHSAQFDEIPVTALVKKPAHVDRTHLEMVDLLADNVAQTELDT